MKIIAHRGASGEFPENSLVAFQQAMKQGCDGIELDVQYHQPSGEFILIHDQHLVVNGQRFHINQLSLQQLLEFKPDLQRGICTLPSALQTISKQCLINIEFKSSVQGSELDQQITQLNNILAQAITDNIVNAEQLILSSFNHYAIESASLLLPRFATAALIASCPIHYAEFCQALKVSGLNLSIDCLNQEIVTDAHQRGLEVWVYTVDEPDDIKRCLSYNVDGIFTNFPKRSRKYLLSL